ncbi:MAG TPA: hypothetical protein VFX13_06335 [Gaiellales bacterium]|jgi:hypothetical protein|nr:hypothetical protein [Gaiellales bacterium]
MTQDSIARWEWEGGTTAAEPRIPEYSPAGEAPLLRAAGEDVHTGDDPDEPAAS